VVRDIIITATVHIAKEKIIRHCNALQLIRAKPSLRVSESGKNGARKRRCTKAHHTATVDTANAHTATQHTATHYNIYARNHRCPKPYTALQQYTVQVYILSKHTLQQYALQHTATHCNTYTRVQRPHSCARTHAPTRARTHTHAHTHTHTRTHTHIEKVCVCVRVRMCVCVVALSLSSSSLSLFLSHTPTQVSIA